MNLEKLSQILKEEEEYLGHEVHSDGRIRVYVKTKALVNQFKEVYPNSKNFELIAVSPRK